MIMQGASRTIAATTPIGNTITPRRGSKSKIRIMLCLEDIWGGTNPPVYFCGFLLSRDSFRLTLLGSLRFTLPRSFRFTLPGSFRFTLPGNFRASLRAGILR